MSDVRGVRGDESLPGPFMPLEGVQEVLSISRSQAYALVRSGELRAIRVGGRGQWRVEEAELERSEEHTSELQSRGHLVCRLLLEEKQSLDDLTKNDE